ncbi:MAG: hypothetical protein EOO53_20375 [Gammaproteobacteria bacterium]|nr:MAG: hypothetical protein EOO53_20375 [Gammaproteobacteria bacterium]
MKVKTGKDEIVYLLEKVFEKYESETGESVARNTNRKNYEGVARRLSEISSELPYTSDKLFHVSYSTDYNPKNLEYPYRKYDITSSQIKDAYFGMVANPRPFLVDACYIYLYNIGRKGFEQNPQDANLLIGEKSEDSELDALKKEVDVLRLHLSGIEQEPSKSLEQKSATVTRSTRMLFVALLIAIALLVFTAIQWQQMKSQWATIKTDMKILPYTPTKAEIDSLEGVWLCYTGSPQARISDPSRYHMVVSNVVDVKYKNGYFTFTRYGASFDHTGYMQFEAPWLVSIHSYVKNEKDSIESPRHSLMRLNMEKPFVSVISASWSFDVGSRNNVIGIREVYIKQGKGGRIEEVINTIENASCHCKIIRWHQNNNTTNFYLKNVLLDTISDDRLKKLLNEKSILLRVPQEGIVINDTIPPVRQ